MNRNDPKLLLDGLWDRLARRAQLPRRARRIIVESITGVLSEAYDWTN